MMSQSTHKSTHRSWVMIILALVMVSATAQMVSADAGSQTWFLSSDNTTGNHTMYKGSQSGGISNVSINPTDSVIWVANQSAEHNVSFAAGNWTGQLTTTTGSEHYWFNVAIGVWDGSSFTSRRNVNGNFGGADNASFTIRADDAFTVPAGQYLAFKVINTGNDIFTIVTNGGPSYVSSPCSDPGYPVPELPTLVLVSAGLLMLVGYVYMGRRNK